MCYCCQTSVPQLSAGEESRQSFLSFETMSYHFMIAYRIGSEVLVKHESPVVTTTEVLRHMAGAYVIQF